MNSGCGYSRRSRIVARQLALRIGGFEGLARKYLLWGEYVATARLSVDRQGLGGPSTIDSSVAERVVLMCASALFTGLSQHECLEIASCSKARTYARDELLFMQGQPVRNLVLIQSGSVKSTQLSPNGNEVILWMNGSGDAVGVAGDPSACNHTCSARAMEQCRALTWEYAKLRNLLVEYPQIRSNISQILSGRLNELDRKSTRL